MSRDATELEELRRLMVDAERAYVRGRFSTLRRAELEEWAAKGEVEELHRKEGRAWCNLRTVRATSLRTDFRRLPGVGLELRRGDRYIDRLCGTNLEVTVSLLLRLMRQARRDGATLWLESWTEDGLRTSLLNAMGARRTILRITAASEYRTVWQLTGPEWRLPEPAPHSEALCLARLNLPTLELGAAELALARLEGEYAQHYSSYNLRSSWSALALRGFGHHTFIEKPTEMPKAWREANAHRLAAICEDTDLRAQLPELDHLIAAIPGEKERIRLMRLAPGGGELARHADITDRDAGTTTGKLLRIHLPLRTNPGVTFTSWDLEGEPLERHMAQGEAWYLDTRKAHTAINAGTTERIHLVLDVWSCPELLSLLP